LSKLGADDSTKNGLCKHFGVMLYINLKENAMFLLPLVNKSGGQERIITAEHDTLMN
jgi:hypothetical protein